MVGGDKFSEWLVRWVLWGSRLVLSCPVRFPHRSVSQIRQARQASWSAVRQISFGGEW